jgi:hypothetical protein
MRVIDVSTGVKIRTFALGTSVLAGNMYAAGRLLKQPPYHFQLVADEEEFRILRTPAEPINGIQANKKTVKAMDDTHGKAGEHFDSIKVHLAYEPSVVLNDFSEIKAAYDRLQRISAIFSIATSDQQRVEVEFPIYHFNILPDQQKWQAETGPVLLAATSPANGNHSILDTLPCFLHFNSYQYLTVFWDYPLGHRARSHDELQQGQLLHGHIQLITNKA